MTTIVLLVSRKDFLPEVLSGLESLECDQTRVNILCIVDGDDNLYTQTRNKIQGTKFNERLTIKFPNKNQPQRFDIMGRRRQIAKIHKFAKDYINHSDLIFLVEDDTVIPKDSLIKLTRALSSVSGAVMAEGVEVGRWGNRYVGVWEFDDIYKPTKLMSKAYKDSGVEMIDAGGFYCVLVKADLYLSHTFDLFENLGPDVSMGLELRRQGYINLVDWSVKCKHLNITKKDEREILYPDESVEQVTLSRKNEFLWIQNN